jgi:hypothetical protein
MANFLLYQVLYIYRYVLYIFYASEETQLLLIDRLYEEAGRIRVI